MNLVESGGKSINIPHNSIKLSKFLEMSSGHRFSPSKSQNKDMTLGTCSLETQKYAN